MTTSLFHRLRTQLWRSRTQGEKGFTLIELLVVTLIAGGLVSGLMYLVVELLTADQRDASRNATQQDMQRSLNYISTELRDAVYVYSGECLYGGAGCPDRTGGLLNYLPASLRNNSVPVLAFWKQTPLPSRVQQFCNGFSGRRTATSQEMRNVPCDIGHAYALIVYSLNTETNNPIWTGEARLTRYELRAFSNTTPPQPTAGYVTPIDGEQKLFYTWPFKGTINSQGGQPGGSAVPLTDFVDRNSGSTPTCPANYSMSPPLNTPGRSDSFYACINTTGAAGAELDNQELLIYLRGNAFGRPGVNTRNSFTPTLTTRVLNRGTLDIDPDSQ